MIFCTGCNITLGWKKYNFQKQWRISGYYCKDCMKKIGQNWDNNGRITLQTKPCDLCKQEFFFLTTTLQNKQYHHCCHICRDLDFELTKNMVPPIPPKIPMLMGIFASFGILLMFVGFGYVVFVAPQQDFNILHIILGSSMSAAGFMLARKMIKVRNVMLKLPPKTSTD